MFELKTFTCPNCKKPVDSTMRVCEFCEVEFDPAFIAASVETEEKVEAAYNYARHIRTMAGALIALYLISCIPFVGYLSIIAFSIMYLAIPILMVIWAIKYSGINTNDPDLNTAKKYLGITLLIWLAFPVAYGFIWLLVP